MKPMGLANYFRAKLGNLAHAANIKREIVCRSWDFLNFFDTPDVVKAVKIE